MDTGMFVAKKNAFNFWFWREEVLKIGSELRAGIAASVY